MPAGRGYKGWGQKRLAVARSRKVAGTTGGGGTRVVPLKRALSGRAWAVTRGQGRKVGLRRQLAAPRRRSAAAKRRLSTRYR